MLIERVSEEIQGTRKFKEDSLDFIPNKRYIKPTYIVYTVYIYMNKYIQIDSAMVFHMNVGHSHDTIFFFVWFISGYPADFSKKVSTHPRQSPATMKPQPVGKGLRRVLFQFGVLVHNLFRFSLSRKQPQIHMCQGLNSHCFHIIGDGHQFNSRWFIYPLYGFPIKGGMSLSPI